VGGSQGGGAIWAANEQAATRAPELKLVGVVALVPAARFAAYADLAAAGTLGPDQRAAYIWMVMALSRGHPDLDVDLYRHGFAAKNWETLSYCFGPRAQARNDAVAQVTAEELKPATTEATNRLRSLLAEMELPQRKTSAPMLVIYAGRDSFLDPAWTRAAIAESCKLGSQIEDIYQPEAGHGTVDISAAVPWLAQRFAGAPPTGGCN
jgi:pimeloyl-ACP methyl ester carboxylesterase